MHPAPSTTLTADGLFGLSEGQRLLAVVSHPDDETIGPGGTLYRAAAAGIVVDVLAVACRTRPMWGGDSDPAVRVKEFNAACDALGVYGRIIAWVDDERAHTPGNHPSDLVTLIESGTEVSLSETRPDLMLIPSATGFHQDHLAVHHAGIAAARLGGNGKPTPRIVLGYCGPEDVWTRTVEAWTVLVDTTDSWPAKEQALRAHASQLRDWPHPRSLEGIRKLDAANGVRIGTDLAEQFVAYRIAF